MRVKRLAITRQEDNTFAIVATIESSDGSKRDVVLEGGSSKANELQHAFMVYMNDEDSLQVEIQFKLQEAI